MMSDEQLQRALQEVSEGLDKLSDPDRPLTGEEKKYQAKLLRRQTVLSQIKMAKEKNRKDVELYYTTIYDMLVPWGEKHPVLMFFMLNMMRVRWGAGSFQRF